MFDLLVEGIAFVELPSVGKNVTTLPGAGKTAIELSSAGKAAVELPGVAKTELPSAAKTNGELPKLCRNVVKQAIVKHEKEINGLRKQVMALEAENTHLKAKNDEVRKAGFDVAQWCKTTKLKYEKTLSDLRNVVKERETLNDQLCKLKKEKEVMDAETQSLEEERVLTRTRYFEWKATNDKMKVMHDRAVEVRAEANQEVTIIQGNLDKVTKKLNNVMHNNAVLYNSCKLKVMG
ncbi:hypothetical protein FRX31_032768 [Thalictrum thalictroides]|uniref:Uncharacterized protein n=1 Tax=Thalictrum thalictroides TaxID=46969 RepID=A0A7J6V047_THATH|nr:hypothetical protein FRX31_032768 [Thalictrum thalictroides]